MMNSVYDVTAGNFKLIGTKRKEDFFHGIRSVIYFRSINPY